MFYCLTIASSFTERSVPPHTQLLSPAQLCPWGPPALFCPMAKDDQGKLATDSRASSFSEAPLAPKMPKRDLKLFLCTSWIDCTPLDVTVINAAIPWHCICLWDNQPVTVWRAATASYYCHSPSGKHSARVSDSHSITPHCKLLITHRLKTESFSLFMYLIWNNMG